MDAITHRSRNNDTTLDEPIHSGNSSSDDNVWEDEQEKTPDQGALSVASVGTSSSDNGRSGGSTAHGNDTRVRGGNNTSLRGGRKNRR